MIVQAGVGCKYTNDTQHLLLEHFDTIKNSPSHVYHSALPLSPSSSWLRKHYSAELSLTVKVIKGIPAEWGMCSRTVLLDSVGQDLSYYNNTIAVGSESGDIIILNAITGSQTAVLSGHTDEVNSLTFSSDGTSLVSGSDDCTVKLWDLQTGGVVKTFSGHNGLVRSVSISVDCTRIASGSNDNTIRLWDIQTGECHQTIKQQHIVFHISFPLTDPQHQHLMFMCGGKVCQWSTSGHQVKPSYNGFHFAFSSDGAQFVSCDGEVVTIRNSDSGETVAEFNVAKRGSCCCFSPDNRLVAVAAYETVYVWDITNSDPHQIETFIGHTKRITSLVFSSPSALISASEDQSIKFWQIGAPSTNSVMNDPKSISPTSVPIQSITLHAKDDIVITIDSDGVVKTWDISTGLCKASFQTPAKGTGYKDVQLSDGRLIFIWYTDADKKINIWDAEKGELWGVDYKSQWSVRDLRISGDGLRVFCLNLDYIQAWSIQSGEFMGQVNVKGTPDKRTLTVDGSRVWICCSNSKYEGWDFGMPGSLPVQLPKMPPHKLHSNGTILWDISISGIKDTAGKVVFQLPRGFARHGDVQWNGQHLVMCFLPKEVLILDLSYLFPQ